MTLEDGTTLSPALGIGAFAEKTLVAAGQCTKVDPAAKPEVAGLLGCGVMAGPGRGHQHRAGHPGRLGGRHRLRRGGRRGRPGGRAQRGADDHRGGHRPAQAGVGPAIRRHPRDQLPGHRPGRGDPGADRRERRGRGDRGDRPPGDLPAGVLRPGPGRARSSWSACPPRRCASICRCSTCSAAAARSSRPGTATACRNGTSRCSSTCTCRAGCRWTSSSPRRSRWTRSRRRSPRWSAGEVLRSVVTLRMTRADREGRHLGHLLPGRAGLRGRQQRLADRRRARGPGHRRGPRPGRDPGRGGRQRGCPPSSAPTGTTTTSTRRRRSPTPRARRCCCIRATRCCGG